MLLSPTDGELSSPRWSASGCTRRPRLKDKLLNWSARTSHRCRPHRGFIDSVGLGVLIGGLRGPARAEGTLCWPGPNPRIRRILDITGLSAFTVVPDVDGALDALAKECQVWLRGRRKEEPSGSDRFGGAADTA